MARRFERDAEAKRERFERDAELLDIERAKSEAPPVQPRARRRPAT
jgi:hypothetical protein